MRASVLTLGGAAESLFVLTVFRLNTRVDQTGRLKQGECHQKMRKKAFPFRDKTDGEVIMLRHLF